MRGPWEVRWTQGAHWQPPRHCTTRRQHPPHTAVGQQAHAHAPRLLSMLISPTCEEAPGGQVAAG